MAAVGGTGRLAGWPDLWPQGRTRALPRLVAGEIRLMSTPAFRLLLALILACCGAAPALAEEDRELNVYNWADYIAPHTISNFEKEYGIKVNYDLYDSTEVVEAKLLAGRTGYDVVIHSARYSARLIPI